MARQKDSDQQTKRSSGRNTTTIWEWLLAAFGLILVSIVIGESLYRAATENVTPPQFQFFVDSIEPNGANYLVKYRLKNFGSRTAAAVNIEGVLKKGDEEVESSTATLTYAPANSERRGGLFFTKNPTEFELQIRATGYEEP